MSKRNSREIQAVRVVADSNFSPTLDASLCFKEADGSVNNLGIAIRISEDFDAPGVLPKINLHISWRGKLRLRFKDEPIDSVLFAVSNPSALRTLLLDLSAHLSDIASHRYLSDK